MSDCVALGGQVPLLEGRRASKHCGALALEVGYDRSFLVVELLPS